jgi:hypothetical protein
MQGQRSLTWAYVFFGCGALSALLGYWRLYSAHTVPASRLVLGTVTLGLMAALFVAITLRVSHDLRDVPTPNVRSRVLMGGGIALFLVSMALSLR